MCDIQKLVTLLRENVDAVCSGRSLLVLTVPVLQKLNESFVLINEHVQTSKETAVQVPADTIVEQRLLDDLSFLLRLIRKTPGLRLVSSGSLYRPGPGEQPQAPVVSVEHFHSLCHLVLHKVRLSDVQGLSTLRPRLVSLCCDSDPEPLLAGRAAWPELRTVSFCHTGMATVPASLAASAPSLAVLDLSRNRLSDAAGADFSAFRSLSRLSLAYNLFEAVPSDLPPGLAALGLACNYIDNINGVSRLGRLLQLDLSGNCLPEHGCLAPLSQLPALRWLDLRGNPLAFHPRHRALAAAHLHPDARTCESECAAGLAGRRDRGRGSRESVVAVTVATEQPSPVLVERPPPEDSLSTRSSTASDKTLIADDVLPGRKRSTTGHDGSSSKPASARKPRHVRKAVISDLETADSAEDSSLTRSISSIHSSPPDSSAEHLETKRRVENLRQMFGHDNWLHSQGGTFLQDVLGLPPTAITASALLGGTMLDGVEAAPAVPPVDNPTTVEVDDVEVLMKASEDASEDLCEHTVPSEEENEQEEEEQIIPPPDDEGEDDEREQQLYTVRSLALGKQQPLELFLAITDRQLKERDMATGRQLCRWQTEALQSCELLSAEPSRIRVTFDTVRPDRRERTYFVEDVKDAQRLLQTLRAILDERPLQANNLSIFRCMKCSSQFSEEVKSPLVPDARLGETLQCPNCGSVVVVHVEEEPVRAAPTASCATTVPPLSSEESRVPKSPSQSSIGSAASLDTSGEPSVSALLSGTGSGGPRRCESDIEIISNPSQSSIEVLDSTGARTPGRKRSSEERQALPATAVVGAPFGPQLPPLLPTLPPPMTESSSSDSLTDSVCTAYEGRTPATPAASTVTPQTGLPPALLTAEPVATPKAFPGAPRLSTNALAATPPSNAPQYSYTDFGQVDHRIKLHLYVSVFQKHDEELTTLVKGHVLYKNMTQPKPALVVLSTHKVYLLYITRQESDEPQRWLVLVDSWPLRQLQEARALPWCQGLALTTSGSAPSTLQLLLYDPERTLAFLTHLAGLELASWCRMEWEPLPQHLEAVQSLALAPGCADPGVRAAACFVAATIVTDSGTSALGPGLLVVSESALFLSTDSLIWLTPASGKLPELSATQTISNLVEVEVSGEMVTPVFLDETSGNAREIRWVLEMGTAAVVSALLDAVRPPWEQLFSLPLQVSLSS